MTIEWPWKRQKITLEKDVAALEAALEELFKPVTPRVEFVKNLRVDLVGKPKRKLFSMPESPWQKGFLVAGGLVSFVAMVFSGVRIVIAIVGMFKAGKEKALKNRLGESPVPV